VPSAPAWQAPGVFNPAAATASGAFCSGSSSGGGGGSASWRRHLAVIAANRTPGDETAMLQLGSQLLAAGRVLPAHICFVLAGALLQPWDLAAATAAGAAGSSSPGPAGQMLPPVPAPGGGAASSRSASAAAAQGPPLVLLGADAVCRPRCCAQLGHILQTEVFTWSRTVGESLIPQVTVAGHRGIWVGSWVCRAKVPRQGMPRNLAASHTHDHWASRKPLPSPNPVSPCASATTSNNHSHPNQHSARCP